MQGLAFVSLPFYFEDVLHRSQVETGFFMTPWPLVVAIMAPIEAICPTAIRSASSGGIGLVLLGIGMALLAMLPPDPSDCQDIVWRTVICGIGFGFFQTPNLRALMPSAPPHRVGEKREQHRGDRPPDRDKRWAQRCGPVAAPSPVMMAQTGLR